MSVGSWLNSLEFLHLEALGVSGCKLFDVGAVGDSIMGHGRGFGVSSGVVKAEWLGGLSKDLVLAAQALFGNLTVVVRHNITNWGSWSIWSSISKLFSWDHNLHVCSALLHAWQSTGESLSEVSL